MLANIIATIMMALGVATGNVSSNVYKSGNAFYDVEQQHSKPIQKAEETITKNYKYYNTGTIYNNNKKFYLQKDNETPSANLYDAYFNMYNTTYFVLKDVDNGWNCLLLSFMKINTYYNFTDTEITIKQDSLLTNPNTDNFAIYVNKNNFITTQNIDEWIDMTMNAENSNKLENYRSLITRQNEIFNTTYITNTSQGIYTIDNGLNEYTISNIQANQEINIVMVYNFIILGANYKNAWGTVDPKSMTIKSIAVTPTINYEIIDVPNVMYTVLTMPFSFISTAFNLTIFAGTPYALNFGNLFLTIVAVFILLWLIKKVFH